MKQKKQKNNNNCEVTKCFNCQEIGHTVKECATDVKCTVFEKLGHNSGNCPVSFANKINSAALTWVKEPSVLRQKDIVTDRGKEVHKPGGGGGIEITDSVDINQTCVEGSQELSMDTENIENQTDAINRSQINMF